MTRYHDMRALPEDDRITTIGEAIMRWAAGSIIGVVVDNVPGKADRYIRKITSRFPEIEVVRTTMGAAKTTIVIALRRKA